MEITYRYAMSTELLKLIMLFSKFFKISLPSADISISAVRTFHYIPPHILRFNSEFQSSVFLDRLYTKFTNVGHKLLQVEFQFCINTVCTITV